MIFAKNNLIVKIECSDLPEYAILNPISGSFDIMSEKELNMLEKIKHGIQDNSEFSSYLIERGYAYNNPLKEESAISRAYDEFKQEVSSSQVQLMLIPTYGCNLACTYCFQHGIDGSPTLISKETVDSFFDYAKSNFLGSHKKPFITLFGGEPLVNSPAQRNMIEYIVDKCVDSGYELSTVTNGYDFVEYFDILKKASIKEIQFTLDGSREIHDSRRATANKKGTFDKIIEGIELCVNNKIPVNLRSVVDSENIKDIVRLAEFIDKKGLLDLPPELFKTQIGRNYELFDCYAKPQYLMTQVELWAEFALLSKSYPVLAKFHRPDFKGIRYLVDTSEMYMASFDTCPACKTEWVFDLYGDIYGCTASCGREEYKLGTYFPEVNLNQNTINLWQKRDVKSISKCNDCKYDVICGGGCGVVAANKNNGDILSPDCRPIQEIIEIGINHYIDDIKIMIDDENDEDIIVEKMCCDCDLNEPEEVVEQSCCSSTPGKFSSCCDKKISNKVSHSESTKSNTPSCCNANKPDGCVICGQELLYTKDLPTQEICNICGKNFETYVKCSNGHYICDSCHSLDILGKVEQLLISSSDNNPIVLAQKVFELPDLNMHGPEYHSIVPAILVTAYQNFSDKKEASKIKESIKRGKEVKGGNCGFYGNCGAGVGSGIAVSIIEGATPMSKNERGIANKATGLALLEISNFGGPRCCKRESITSIESFMKVTSYFDGLHKVEYICKQFGKNKDCIGEKCPYFHSNRI